MGLAIVLGVSGPFSGVPLLVQRLTRQIWFRVSLFAVGGVLAATAGIVLGPFLPDDDWGLIGSGALDDILNILASSMLVVTTFSLTTMVSALVAASSNVTPRATRLLADDSTSQNVLGTFAGAFLFSLVAIIALGTELYGASGRAILFGATLVVILIVVVTLLHWIDYVARLGRVDDTTRKVEEATQKALAQRLKHPNLGGRPSRSGHDRPPHGSSPIFTTQIGYCRSIDMKALNRCAMDAGREIWLAVLPGTFVHPGQPLAFSVEAGSPTDVSGSGDRICQCFEIGDARSYDQDPRFGLCVLREIAQRALSPAVNDPGTAIDVIGRAVRLLSMIGRHVEAVEPEYAHLWVPTETVHEYLDDVFPAIARDSASMVEVHVRLQKALAALARTGSSELADASRRQSRDAAARFASGTATEIEKSLVKQLSETV